VPQRAGVRHDEPVTTGSVTVRTGLDRLRAGEGPALEGAPVALLCHPASVDSSLLHARPLLAELGADVVSLLGPEHGIDAAAQDMETVADGDLVRPRTADGTPIYSLYGDTFDSLIPTPDMFHGAAWLVCDLQDVGARYYTYVWTVVLATEVALAAGVRVLVLDRPNPLGGTEAGVEGGAVEPGEESFVGLHDVAVRHGMSVGELVRMAVTERRGEAPREDQLTVLACAGWRRDMLFSDTGLPWVLPSPNMPTLDTALVYPGQCLLEGTNLSEGRGTTRPFELFGAPWIDGQATLNALSPDDFPGLGLRPVGFKPMFQKHGGRRCGGLQLHVRDPAAVRSLRSTWALLRAMWHVGGFGEGRMQWRTERYEFVDDRPALDLLAGGPWLRAAIEAGETAASIEASQADARAAFLRRRAPFLIYD